MPIRVRYKNDSSQECTIRPTPLVAISTNILKNGAGEAFGVTYSIKENLDIELGFDYDLEAEDRSDIKMIATFSF